MVPLSTSEYLRLFQTLAILCPVIYAFDPNFNLSDQTISTRNVTTVKVGNDTYSFHPTHDDGPYSVSQYSITCCRNGTPIADPSLEPYIHEWSQELMGDTGGSGASGGGGGKNKTCRRFTGYYSVPSDILRQQNKAGVGVRCKCPEDVENLDRNCRYLPDCANGGYRSFSINLRCVCPPQWFGELCEKFCMNGVLYKPTPSEASNAADDASDRQSQDDVVAGVDRCRCMNDFYGEACDQIRCYNGGTPIKGRACLCMPPYVGLHCEEVSASAGGGSGGGIGDGSGTSFHRDLSGTVVSLFLAVALALGVYFLVRRRTQWMRQRARMRRAMMNGGVGGDDANGGGTTTGTTLTSTGFANVPQQQPPGYYYNGMPPSIAMDSRSTIMDVNGLPPPPAYSEVIKFPPPAYSDVNERPQASGGVPAADNDPTSTTAVVAEGAPETSSAISTPENQEQDNSVDQLQNNETAVSGNTADTVIGPNVENTHTDAPVAVINTAGDHHHDNLRL